MMDLCALLNFFGFIKKIPVSCLPNISSLIYFNIKLAPLSIGWNSDEERKWH